jgi:hypothetical protein
VLDGPASGNNNDAAIIAYLNANDVESGSARAADGFGEIGLTEFARLTRHGRTRWDYGDNTIRDLAARGESVCAGDLPAWRGARSKLAP